MLAINTLKQRLAALAHWHGEHGFVDPTRAPLVRKVLKGIQTLHPRVEKQATPLQLSQLTQVADWLDASILASQGRSDQAGALRAMRDRALVLLGFWRGFRGDELIRLRIEHLTIVPNEGMICFLPRSKGDRQSQGNTYKVPALSRLCPVTATSQWLQACAITSGPVFHGVDQWGHLGEKALHPNSLIPLLRDLFTCAGLEAVAGYSSHSLRRGFAGWANDNGWDVKALMEYVGWRDVHSAMRYIQGRDPFARHKMEAGLQSPPRHYRGVAWSGGRTTAADHPRTASAADPVHAQGTRRCQGPSPDGSHDVGTLPGAPPGHGRHPVPADRITRRPAPWQSSRPKA